MEIKAQYEKWHSTISDYIDEKYYNWILNNLKPDSGDIALDVACGKGHLLRFYEDIGLTAFGIDISIVALREAKKNLKSSHLVLASGEYLPFKESSFNIITCLGSLEHFIYPERGVNEMSQALKKDGLAYVLLPNAYFIGHIYMVYKTGEPPDEGGQSFSECFQTRRSWERLLCSNGLPVIQCLKYNKISKASKKVSYSVRFLYNIFVAPILPINLSYAFMFVCKKHNAFSAHGCSDNCQKTPDVKLLIVGTGQLKNIGLPV
jgi:ubiquinone/menaquinone biosynthesis C-methylase UbiE